MTGGRKALAAFSPEPPAEERAEHALSSWIVPSLAVLLTGAVPCALLKGPWPAAAVFPWALGAMCLVFLGAGAFWASFLGGAATLGALLAIFYAPNLPHQVALFVDVTVLWICFAQLLRTDLDQKTSVGRQAERIDRLRLDIDRRVKEGADDERETGSVQERIAAYNRLRFFADDLIGAYNREELAHRSHEGLEALFHKSSARVALFPASNEPALEDDLGHRVLRQGGARLYPAADARLPSRAGRLLLLPLRVRDSTIGWISLERAAGEPPFDLQDLRLSLIAVDLIAMSLGNAERYAQIETLAVSDGLTGLYTRGYFDERLQEEFAKARHQGLPFSVLLLDLDHFKKVNDEHGHRLGDEVLRWIARQIAARCRDTDFVARYGGEEFVVLMPNTGGNDALAFARRLGKSLGESAFRWEKTSLKVTISGGVAALSDDVTTETELLTRADRALYRAKDAGRDRVLLHE